MAEVLIVFDDVVYGEGTGYRARVCGRPIGSGWEGWLEFEPIGRSGALRTARETSQPNRADLLYWATGLSHTYMEGALDRALNPVKKPTPRVVDAQPAFEEPRPPISRDPTQAVVAKPEQAVLDPFFVYAQGVERLRAQLRALSHEQLMHIVRAHALDIPSPPSDIPALAEAIVQAVRVRVDSERPVV